MLKVKQHELEARIAKTAKTINRLHDLKERTSKNIGILTVLLREDVEAVASGFVEETEGRSRAIATRVEVTTNTGGAHHQKFEVNFGKKKVNSASSVATQNNMMDRLNKHFKTSTLFYTSSLGGNAKECNAISDLCRQGRIARVRRGVYSKPANTISTKQSERTKKLSGQKLFRGNETNLLTAMKKHPHRIYEAADAMKILGCERMTASFTLFALATKKLIHRVGYGKYRVWK